MTLKGSLQFVMTALVVVTLRASSASATCEPGSSNIQDFYTGVISNASLNTAMPSHVLFTVYNADPINNVTVVWSDQKQKFDRFVPCGLVLSEPQVECGVIQLGPLETATHVVTLPPSPGAIAVTTMVGGNSGRIPAVVSAELIRVSLNTASNTNETQFYDHIILDRDACR